MAQAEKPQKSADAFRTISEVSEILEVPQHVLRFWEGKFSQIKPMKRGGNRRYYRPEDLELLRAITHLLYTDGYTIKGVQKLLRENGVRATVNAHISQHGAFQSDDAAEAAEASLDPAGQGDQGAEPILDMAEADSVDEPIEVSEPAVQTLVSENGGAPEDDQVPSPGAGPIADAQEIIEELRRIRTLLQP